jgi:hypothetical protein
MPADDSYPAEAAYDEAPRSARTPPEERDWQHEEDASRSDASAEPPGSLPEFFSRLRK